MDDFPNFSYFKDAQDYVDKIFKGEYTKEGDIYIVKRKILDNIFMIKYISDNKDSLERVRKKMIIEKL